MSNIAHNLEEGLLLEQLVQNNERAFRKLYETYHNDVYAYSKSMIKDKAYAEGVVQEVFMKVWMNRANLDPNLSFKAYVFRLSRNITINLLKKSAREDKLKEIIFYKTKSLYGPSAEDGINEKEYEEIRRKLIDRLPPKRKRIFEMSRNEGLSYQEIGSELGISESTVKTQMSKALETIRTLLCKQGDVTYIIVMLSLDLLWSGLFFPLSFRFF